MCSAFTAVCDIRGEACFAAVRGYAVAVTIAGTAARQGAASGAARCRGMREQTGGSARGTIRQGVELRLAPVRGNGIAVAVARAAARKGTDSGAASSRR